MKRLLPPPYVCISCTRRITARSACATRDNGSPQPSRSYSSVAATPSRPLKTTTKLATTLLPAPHNAYSTAVPPRKGLRIAIIGSGPAGFYTAHRLLHKVQDAVIDMYEQLPVPYGLVRFGVAPDHPEVKNCQDTFEEVAQSPRFNYIGNVRVGHHIELAKLKPHYDAMLFSYGADEDRRLGIPGEDLEGVFSARAFVGWYNGLPQFHNLKPDLQSGEHAVVVGQGNVALDVARILLAPLDHLKKTDITEQAIQALSESKIKHVRVVGRRGPLQVAFTVKEARELMKIPSIAFHDIDRSFYPIEIKKLPRVQKRTAEVLLKGSTATPEEVERSWTLDFLRAPTSMNAEQGSNHLSSMTFRKQQFVPDADPLDPSARVQPTEDDITVPASLAFRSVGYKSTALRGLSDLGVPFDSKLGIIPNDVHGRVISPDAGPGSLTAGHISGLYCAGWVKRGPTGVIASTMQDAFTSADVIAYDWENNAKFLNDAHGEDKSTHLGWDGVKAEVEAKGVRPLSWNDWKRIDEAERARGREKGKKREKFASVAEMLQVLDA
ncbi:NADPH:adrenodoxin oxidoreductase mitochondrial precursor [Macroventuria anomochaeta]|uniref:NADPH:adrenodoxin oxidoreductase mitochondrial n=1 Tax=Macroventuria anomochaeta TaxID=301207 RepID=A0ACB6S770_9PLEO|nr:NADPH:adrenodoxin oxidoreductase mitochondrial precursor [Macroventuria anomochaeta]KAF2628972.1 NADPH:adrenodoxin oxidoreductase mitochondrial precursor [Macroventuria anomochaeta]